MPRAVPSAVPPLELQQIATSLDEVTAGLAEFGTVGISNPLLVSPGSSTETRAAFTFNPPTATDDKFFADAKSEFQGRAAEFEQIAQSLSIGASVAVDPTIAAAYAAQVSQYYQAQTQSLQRQGVLSEKLRLHNQAAAATRDQEKAMAEKEYQQAVGAAPNDLAIRAAAEEKRKAAFAAADTKYANALQVPEAVTLPPYPTPSAAPAPADANLAKSPTEARGLLSNMAGYGGLLASKPAPTLSNRSAIVTAAGDRATTAIFRVLGDPTLAQFEDRLLLFGVSMVSVNPGWRTRRGYAADIAVRARYAYREADANVIESFVGDPAYEAGLRRRVADDNGIALPPALASTAPAKGIPEPLKLPPVDGRFEVPIGLSNTPLVAAVSPMTETQALDLSSGYRRQDEFALSLAFALRSAGLAAQAAAFEQFVKSRQQDVATATTAVAVNAYTYSGGLFGFQVGPRLRAVEQMKKRQYSGPADILDRQSFPALVLIGIDRPNLYTLSEKDGKFRVHQVQLLLVSTPSWLPIEQETADAKLTEGTRIAWRYRLARAQGALPNPGKSDPSLGAAARMADVRADALRYKAFGSGVFIEIPQSVFKNNQNTVK